MEAQSRSHSEADPWDPRAQRLSRADRAGRHVTAIGPRVRLDPRRPLRSGYTPCDALHARAARADGLAYSRDPGDSHGDFPPHRARDARGRRRNDAGVRREVQRRNPRGRRRCSRRFRGGQRGSLMSCSRGHVLCRRDVRRTPNVRQGLLRMCSELRLSGRWHLHGGAMPHHARFGAELAQQHRGRRHQRLLGRARGHRDEGTRRRRCRDHTRLRSELPVGHRGRRSERLLDQPRRQHR